ncbi:30S ribosomal protein S2 [Candidatus Saccharibacteria bacterium]|nr:30S ribosomal protein S2 [Candidatus Saccharibacteria bacterium]
MSNVDMKALLESGAHFGHKTSRWHPKMAQYIHSKRGEGHIIDLEQTVKQLEKALKFIEETSASGKQVLFVGTKRQAKDIIKTEAESVSQPYVVNRWMGGMLTNTNTINTRVKKLKELETKMATGELASKYNKLEVQRYQEQIDVMNYNFGGIKEMNGRPGALFVVDILEESNAVKEATKLGIPVVAIVDTNADPSIVKYPVPANDDAIKAIQLITDYVTSAVEAGRQKHAKKNTDKESSEKEGGEK